ncbi:MAG: hypothetical protein LBQ12_00520, partial [Deltaproteobacteria bacterium]|nr:hypothetical protein [Deltaproteobacteria bacterium]
MTADGRRPGTDSRAAASGDGGGPSAEAPAAGHRPPEPHAPAPPGSLPAGPGPAAVTLKGRILRVLALDGLTGEATVLLDAGAPALVEATGPFGLPVPGESAELEGSYSPGPASPPGAQSPYPALPPRAFAARLPSLYPPRDAEGYVSLLTSGYFPGLDRAGAEAIVRAFGNDALYVLSDAPHRLARGGVLPVGSRERVIVGARAFLELKGLAAALAPSGLGAVPAAKLLSALGPGAAGIAASDPWRAAAALAAAWPGASLGPQKTGAWAARRFIASFGAEPGPAGPGTGRAVPGKGSESPGAGPAGPAAPPKSRSASDARAEGEALVALNAMRAGGDIAVRESRLARAAAGLMPGADASERKRAFREAAGRLWVT